MIQLPNTPALPSSAEAFSRIDPHSIKALTFDMQGSLLDFYSTILDAGTSPKICQTPL